MRKSQIIFWATLILVLAGLTVLAVNKWQTQAQGPTFAQVKSQRDTALIDLKIEKQLDQTDTNRATAYQGQVTALTTQKATLCAQLKAARLVQPICQ